MARFRLCRYCEELHQTNKWPHNCMPEPVKRSELAAPFVIRDDLGFNGIYHHAALKRIDSKRAYSKATREHGCIELGNEYTAATTPKDYGMKADVIESGVNDALHQLGISSESDMGKLSYE